MRHAVYKRLVFLVFAAKLLCGLRQFGRTLNDSLFQFLIQFENGFFGRLRSVRSRTIAVK